MKKNPKRNLWKNFVHTSKARPGALLKGQIGMIEGVTFVESRRVESDMMDALRYSLYVDQNYTYRRVTWQDVLVDWGIFEVALKWAGKYLKAVLITMKDFLLTKSRSFYTSSVSTTLGSKDSTNGWEVKPVPLSPVTKEAVRESKKLLESMNMISSVGSKIRKKGRRSYGTNYPYCVCHNPGRADWAHGKNRCYVKKRSPKGGS